MESNDKNVIDFDEAKNMKEQAGNGKLTIDDKIAIKELEEKLAKMAEDKEAKCKAAKEQLVEQLKITVDKYRTATGTAEALRVLRFVVGEDYAHPAWANRLAWDMAIEVDKMRGKAEKLSYDEMDDLCDGFYEKEFKIEYDSEASDEQSYHLAFEMMRIDLCRNVGGSAEDMVAFIKRVDEEIADTQAKLDELKAGKEG